MTTQTYAQLASGSNVVDNIIVADTSKSLTTLYPDYTLQAVASGVFCMPGMYYNSADSLYYVDADFTTKIPGSDGITTDTTTTTESTSTTDTTTDDSTAS